MNRKAYIRGYALSMAKSAGLWQDIVADKGLGLGASGASSFAQGLLKNRYLRSVLLGGLVGGGVNMWRNREEEQPLWRSFMHGAGVGGAAGLGLQALYPNARQWTNGDPEPVDRIGPVGTDYAIREQERMANQVVPRPPASRDRMDRPVSAGNPAYQLA